MQAIYPITHCNRTCLGKLRYIRLRDPPPPHISAAQTYPLQQPTARFNTQATYPRIQVILAPVHNPLIKMTTVGGSAFVRARGPFPRSCPDSATSYNPVSHNLGLPLQASAS